MSPVTIYYIFFQVHFLRLGGKLVCLFQCMLNFWLVIGPPLMTCVDNLLPKKMDDIHQIDVLQIP